MKCTGSESATDVPSLAEIRPMLPPRVTEWVESVLVGETSRDFARRNGLRIDHIPYSRYVAEAAGLELTVGSNGVREAVLRMRIRELGG